MFDFFKKSKYVIVKPETPSREIPDGLWQKCPGCGEIIFNKELEKNLKVCPKCGYHFKITAYERINFLCDEGSFVEFGRGVLGSNPLGFPGYEEKLAEAREKTGLTEAVVTGIGRINGTKAVIAVMDPNFIMASMGTAVGEKISLAMEKAIEQKLPFIVFTASGGARMQEGIFSLLQMAKTVQLVNRLNAERIFYLVVMTDPTTGGVSASFAALGDIILAEPGALIGFAGPRVIEQTIRQKLPEGFQRAEFLEQHGFVDAVVSRDKLKEVIAKLLALHNQGGLGA
ncbi:acetyl-CoA carboxylase, carboxyltransferase subunit beta [Carboxydothermus pertinax]|uniref:Acetyl-coenzyme A carboxylase carboxyl transferase subunit beta n=1 Tax=Carboxydothermus pertinax TaxID=870242 RepID=A0A1L8CVZ0_9THEO|nr:acetyl-CoA carboxylase, carboxyltransferase subunit beta [Carboxydothermus pertinax]GAV23088.1 acetyl-CoA carboxylase carboxyl transferase subunit beta [Carboxydothermus pertinax]